MYSAILYKLLEQFAFGTVSLLILPRLMIYHLC